MANPFGGSDQTLSANTGHTNYANLVRAFIPRSSSKWVEVLSATSVTGLSSGSYDADGYFAGTDSTRRNAQYSLPANLNPSSGWTLIIGVKYNSAGGSAGGDTYVGILDSVGGTAQFRARLDAYNRRAMGYIVDSNSAQANTLAGTWLSPGGDTFSCVVQGSSSAQKAYTRIGSTNYPASPLTGTDSIGGSAVCDKLQVTYDSLWATQFVFLYNTATISETDINAIMAAPEQVVTYTNSFFPRRMMLGVG
jgi:hypothetical protein